MEITDIFDAKFDKFQGIIFGISGTGKQYNMKDFIIKNNSSATFIEIEDEGTNKKLENK